MGLSGVTFPFQSIDQGLLGKGGLNGMFSAGMGWQVIQASALGSKRGSGELWIHRLAKLPMAGQSLERPSGKTGKVGGLEHEWIIFPIILGMSSSQMTNSIIFQRGWYTNQTCFL